MSEFGKGFLYCIDLFLEHAALHMDSQIEYPGLWFNGSADHLLEMEIPNLPSPQYARIKQWRNKCLVWRLPYKPTDKEATYEDTQWAIREAEEILRMMDMLIQIDTKKANYK